MVSRPVRITVVGGGCCDTETASLAERVGEGIAHGGGVLISGGLGGVMEAASRGSRLAGGMTIGILPGPSAEEANEYVGIPIVTDMGQARNVINVLSGDSVIALPGAAGTLSEIAIALKSGIPVVALAAWGEVAGVVRAATPEEAVRLAFERARESEE